MPVEEPFLPLRAVDPAGALASTMHDMALWGGFLVDPVKEILDPDTMEEMCQPQILADVDSWSAAWGLGLMLVRAEGRTWAGHTGGMPGAITGVFTHRDSATTAVLLMNSSSSPDPAAGAVELSSSAVEHEPVAPEPWVPGRAVPEVLVPLLGRWFSEGRGFTFSVRQGVLEARLDSAADDKPPSVFERVEADVYRTVPGRERGELLRVRSRDDASVRQLNWATYAFTREPCAIGEWLGRPEPRRSR